MKIDIYMAFAIGIFLLIGILLLISKWNYLRDKQIAKIRLKKGYSSNSDFIEPLYKKGIPEEISKALLNYLSKSYWLENYPFLPNDNLRVSINGWQDEHVEYALNEIAKTLHCEPVKEEELAKIETIKTPEDLAFFLHKKKK